MKKFIALLLTTMVVMTGCSDSTNKSTSPGGSGTAALKTVSMFGGTDPAAGAYANLVSTFKADTGIEVNDSSETADENWKATVVTDFNTGNEPDVIFYFSGQTGQPLVSKLVDYDTIKAEYPDYAKDILPSALEQMVEEDGKSYFVPVKGYYEGIFCNKDLFDDYNLELPTDWDKLVKAIETFRAADIDPISISFANEPHYLIEYLLLSAGGVDEHKVVPTTDISSVPDSWYLGLDTFKTLGDLGAFPSDAATKNQDMAVNDFINKKAAMIVDGSWRAGTVTSEGRGEFVEVVAFPQIPGGKGTGTEILAGYSTGFAITKKAWDDPNKREAAVKFVQHMTTKQAVADLIGEGAGAPAADIPVADNLERVIASGFEMTNKASGSDVAVDSRLKQSCWTEIWTNVGDIATGKTTAKDVLEKAIPQNKD